MGRCKILLVVRANLTPPDIETKRQPENHLKEGHLDVIAKLWHLLLSWGPLDFGSLACCQKRPDGTDELVG